MQDLNYYEQQIVKATKCDPSEAAEIEQTMRDVIFHSTLDWQTKRQFNAGARKAKDYLDFLKTPEGMELSARIEDEMLNPEKYRK